MKSVLITGASKGLGKALFEGAQVTPCDSTELGPAPAQGAILRLRVDDQEGAGSGHFAASIRQVLVFHTRGQRG